jgi:hypothetical protein
MAIVEEEFSMVNMMVRSSSNSEKVKQRIPRVDVFTVDKSEVVCVDRSKSHVRPDVAVNYVGCNVERNKDHTHCVSKRAIEGIEEAWVAEDVMGLVGNLVAIWPDPSQKMFKSMGPGLDQVLHA